MHLVVSDVILLCLSWEIIKEYFVQNQIDYREIVSVKKNILSKLVNLIYILDYTSVYQGAWLVSSGQHAREMGYSVYDKNGNWNKDVPDVDPNYYIKKVW